MKRFHSIIPYLQIVLAALIVSFITSSCANIVPPSGGDRDSLPPRLIIANPKDSATNVKAKNITLTFDEFVELDNASENIIYSPVPKNSPLVDYKLRNVTIKYRDSLEPNTTYSIDFGNAIKDVNESNVAKNFRYVFSTGSSIDNNTYSGKVFVAETGKIDSSLLVVLHKDLSDSAIQKLAPRYYTRVNGKGEFKFNNLPTGRFAPYIVNSKSFNRIFDSTELFAFRDSVVVIESNNTQKDTFYAFVQSPREVKRVGDAGASLPPSLRDDKRLRYLPVFDNSLQDLLSNLPLIFNRKLFAVDTTKIQLFDSNYVAIKGYAIQLDSFRRKLTLEYPWKENMVYKLLLQKEAFSDSLSTTLLKTDTITITTKKETEYGSIRFRFMNLDTTLNPVIQIANSDGPIASYPITRTDLSIKRFKPGSYDIRILYDNNKNGRWDSGSFSINKRQPEKVFSIPRTLNIRANWDNEVTIGL